MRQRELDNAGEDLFHRLVAPLDSDYVLCLSPSELLQVADRECANCINKQKSISQIAMQHINKHKVNVFRLKFDA